MERHAVDDKSYSNRQIVLVIRPDQWIYALSLNRGINFKYITFLKTISLV